MCSGVNILYDKIMYHINFHTTAPPAHVHVTITSSPHGIKTSVIDSTTYWWKNDDDDSDIIIITAGFAIGS